MENLLQAADSIVLFDFGESDTVLILNFRFFLEVSVEAVPG
jgi:hypothetical protein